jgi:hypothetical protein
MSAEAALLLTVTLWVVIVIACFSAFKVGGDYDEDT